MSAPYSPESPSLDDVETARGPWLLNFGTDSCGHCRAAAPLIEQALADHPEVRHVKVEDGKGRPLGRTFGVKLWPTLILLRDGQEQDRFVRPTDAQALGEALGRLTGA